MEYAEGSFLDTHPKWQTFMDNMQNKAFCQQSRMDLYEKNIRENLVLADEHGCVDDLKGIGKGRACIFVGASPALNYNIHELENCDENFIVIAVNSSLKMLLENNIKPHIVVAADADPTILERDLTVDTDLSDVMLIAATLVSPEVIKAWDGPVKYVGMGCENEELNKEVCEVLNIDECFPGAGNALGLAVNVAFGVFEAKTYIFVGTEYSFTEGYYVDGKESADKSQQWPAIDIFGNEVKTTAPLLLYWTYLTDMASKTHKFGYMWINSTQAGIFGITKDDGHLPYITQLDLKVAIEKVKEACELAKDPYTLEREKYNLAYQGDKYMRVSHSLREAPEVAKLGDRILDVGCGGGAGVRKLVELGGYAEGCDISTEVAKYWGGIEHLCKSGVTAWDLPYKDGEFNIIMACDVMEHIPPELLYKTMDEFKRVANTLYLTIAFCESYEKIDNRIEPHLSIYPPKFWEDFFNENGWDVMREGQHFLCKRRDN